MCQFLKQELVNVPVILLCIPRSFGSTLCPQEPGLHELPFFFFFFFASLAPSTNGRHEQENKKWEKKDVGAFFLPHSLPCVAILAVTMALPLQTLLEASLCKALALTGF